MAARVLFLAGIALGAHHAANTLNRGVAAYSATLRVDASVGGGQTMEVYINNTSEEPLRAAIIPAVRHTYQFPGVVGDVTMLRVDPTDAADVEVVIYGVEIVAGSRPLRRYGPEQLLGWWKSSIDPRVAGQGFVFRSKDSDPNMVTYDRTQLPRIGGWRVALHNTIFDSPLQPFIWLLPALTLGCLLAGGGSAHLVLVALALLLGPYIVREVMTWPLGAAQVQVAVSRAAFLGESLFVSQAAVSTVLVTAIAVAGAAGWGRGRWASRRQTKAAPLDVQRPSFAPASLQLALAVCALAMLLAPDLRGEISALSSLTYSPHWDFDNILYWAYQAHSGALAFRDFWYPYGGFYLFSLPWPAGPAIQWLHNTLLFGGLLWGLWRLLPESRIRITVIVFLLAVAYRLPVIFQVERYLSGPAIAIGYLAARQNTTVTWSDLGPFWLSIGLALVFDPPQVLYAAPVLLLLTATDLWRERSISKAAILRAAALPLRASLGVTAIVLAIGLLLAVTGQLSAAWTFYTRLAEAVEYSTLPTQYDPSWPIFDLRLAMLLWPALAVIIGTYELARGGDRRLGEGMLALGLLAFLTLQKHLVRPMEFSMLTLALTGSLVYGALCRRSSTIRFQAVEAAIAGMTLAVLMTHGRTDNLEALVVNAPQRSLRSVATLVSAESASRANSERYAPQRFAGFVAEQQLVTEVRKRWHGSGPFSMFMLSDAPITYLLNGQPSVPFANMYSASPLNDQVHVVEWLVATKPDFTAFNPAHLTFDSVPAVVRVPIVVTAVINGYVPAGQVGGFEVLRRRQPGEPVPLDYWRRHLGNAIDLGHVPGVLNSSTYQPCRVETCDVSAIVTLSPSSTRRATATLVLNVGGTPFRIAFATSPERTRYVVPLSRLWIWTAAKAAGASVEVRWGEPSSVVGVSLERLASNKHLLY